MKSISFAIAATAVMVVLVVDALATSRRGELPVPPQGVATIKPGTQVPTITPGNLVASPARLSIVTDRGANALVKFSVSYDGIGGVLDARSSTPAHISNPVSTSLGNGRFSVAVHSSDLLSEGGYRGTLHLRMCTDAGCTNPIAGAAVVVPYVLRVTAGPIITTVVGGGSGPEIGDGGPAIAAQLLNPTSVAVDAAGNIYIAEGADTYTNCRVRKVDRAGIISTFAGNGTRDIPGENVPATSVSVCPRALALDASGNLYIGDWSFRVRRVTPGGIISTVAGNGEYGYSGDGGPATGAQIRQIEDIAIDTLGRLYIVDSSRIRRVGTDSIIRTIAGNGEYHSSGDGGPALAAGMAPGSVVVDTTGDITFVDNSNQSLRRIASDGTVTRIAGGSDKFLSDPLAINSDMYSPRGIALDGNGNLYVANEAHLAHLISPAGIIKAIAGDYIDLGYGGGGGFDGDGGPATSALLNSPRDIALDADGNIYIADTGNNRVRRIAPVHAPRVPIGIDAFHPAATFTIGREAVAVDIGDFNHDGRQDVVAVTASYLPAPDPATDYRLNVLLQQSDGTLSAPVRVALPTSRYVGRVRAADLNRDGYSDVVLATEAGLHVYLGTAIGLQAGPLLRGIPYAEVPGDFLVADVDSDGRTDVVSWMHGRSEGGTHPYDRIGVTIFYGDGQGGMSRLRFIPQEGYAGRLALGDVNRDGRADLLSTWALDLNDSGVAVFYHDGVDGFHTPQITRIGKGGFGGGIATGDFDGDGMLDVLLPRRDTAPRAELAHLRQSSSNTLVFASTWKTYNVPSELAGRDIDGDGLDDLITLHAGWNSIGFQPQRAAFGASWLDTEVKYYIRHDSTNTKPGTLATGDLNADGCTDVAIVNDDYGLQVLYSKRCLSPAWAPPLLFPRVSHGSPVASAAAVPSTLTSPGVPVGSLTTFTRLTKRILHPVDGVYAYVRRTTRSEVASWLGFALFPLVLLWLVPRLRPRL